MLVSNGLLKNATHVIIGSWQTLSVSGPLSTDQCNKLAIGHHYSLLGALSVLASGSHFEVLHLTQVGRAQCTPRVTRRHIDPTAFPPPGGGVRDRDWVLYHIPQWPRTGIVQVLCCTSLSDNPQSFPRSIIALHIDHYRQCCMVTVQQKVARSLWRNLRNGWD